MKKICIGIPSFSAFPPETEEDYMRLMYHLGRRATDFDFYLAIKRKSEQFRARNAIVEAALQIGCDYIWMLDDDHVFDWRKTQCAGPSYEIPLCLVQHLDNNPEIGIVGALYWQRGAQCLPVVMKEGKDGGLYWLRDDELCSGLQEVAVTGGGCMMIRASIFDRIKSPWFEPEFDMGTDVQICTKARIANYKVCCDTSLTIGHVTNEPLVITKENRTTVMTDNARKYAKIQEGMDANWQSASAIQLYRQDAEEYLGTKFDDMCAIANRYNIEDFEKYRNDLPEYYRRRGKSQLARQVLFHHQDWMVEQYGFFLSMFNTEAHGYGIDYCCGSAPIGFELAMRGHKIDFVDIDGTAAYEFTKWRAKKRQIEHRCGWRVSDGPYDYALFMDAIEHLEDWEGVLATVIDRLKPNGGIVTNYFRNIDFKNPEHISMDHSAVRMFLTKKGVYPLNELLWVKKDLGFMDKEGLG